MEYKIHFLKTLHHTHIYTHATGKAWIAMRGDKFGIIVELLVFYRSYLQYAMQKRELRKAIKNAMPQSQAPKP